MPAEPGPAPPAEPTGAYDYRLAVLRSYGPWKQHPPRPVPRRPWKHRPPGGVHEIFAALAHAIDAARSYVYVEDQYFKEFPGGDARFELYPHLRDAAARGVRVLLVGSGVSRPDDIRGGTVNRTLTADIRRKVVEPLPPDAQRNVAVFRVEGVTVHAKIVLVDDRFACIGSANLFSRSMVGTDHELSVAVVDAGTRVRDLRVRLWSDHLRLDPADPEVRARLEDLETSLGAWRPEWRLPGSSPPHLGPALALVGP
jgi:phosphatidylserine/phosphatidylglycerophosphate/cardiolipin synthase-like enzyme